MSQRKFEWYAGLVCVGLLVGCAATPVNHEELDAHPHGELSLAGEQIPSTFSREGEFLVSPVLGEDGGITRVGSLVGLRGDAMTGPALEARWVDAQGEKGDWRPLHATWSEPGQTVWILDFSRPVLGAQLRLPVDETADIQWMLLNATLPADPSLAYEDDAEHPELFEYRSLPEIEGLVTRERWRARPTRCSSQNRAKRRMAVHYTVTPSGGDLAARVRGIQRYHMDNLGWCDIGYHFLVGVDGSIFEGRPLHLLGSHVGGHNTGNIGVAFIGCFQSGSCSSWGPLTPPDAMIRAGGRLIGELSRMHAIPISSATVKGHNDHAGQSTSCPGDRLEAKIDEMLSYARDEESPPAPPAPTPPAAPTPDPEPEPEPEPPVASDCTSLSCGTCESTTGCTYCGSLGRCIREEEASACTYGGETPAARCAADSYWPCGSTSCWNPRVTRGACRDWSIDEDFRSGRFSIHRYWMSIAPGEPLRLTLEHRGGDGFTPALLVTDRGGRMIYAGDPASLHSEVRVTEASAGRDASGVSVTLATARATNLFVYVTSWEVIDAAYAPRVTTSARYRLLARPDC